MQRKSTRDSTSVANDLHSAQRKKNQKKSEPGPIPLLWNCAFFLCRINPLQFTQIYRSKKKRAERRQNQRISSCLVDSKQEKEEEKVSINTLSHLYSVVSSQLWSNITNPNKAWNSTGIYIHIYIYLFIVRQKRNLCICKSLSVSVELQSYCHVTVAAASSYFFLRYFLSACMSTPMTPE